MLLQTSSLKPTVKPILNLEKYQDPLKVRIAETIINHFKEVAPKEDISQSHLDNLVLSEFNRIQEANAQQRQQQHLQGECYRLFFLKTGT